MNNLIKAIISGVTFGLISLTSVNATAVQHTGVPMKHARATELQQEISAAFVEQSFENARLHSPFAGFKARPTAKSANGSELAKEMIEYAAKFLGTPYVWGSTGPKSFDCSGFTSYVYRKFGIHINRTSGQQYTQGTKVNVKNLQPGDLLFFSSRRSGRRGVGHVAMVASVDRENGTCKFIHASTRRGVVYQNFPDNGYYSNHFIGAKRIINDGHIEAFNNK